MVQTATCGPVVEFTVVVWTDCKVSIACAHFSRASLTVFSCKVAVEHLWRLITQRAAKGSIRADDYGCAKLHPSPSRVSSQEVGEIERNEHRRGGFEEKVRVWSIECFQS